MINTKIEMFRTEVKFNDLKAQGEARSYPGTSVRKTAFPDRRNTDGRCKSYTGSRYEYYIKTAQCAVL